jgi:hypothetical protein
MPDTNHDWPFADPPNTAVFTSRDIVDGQDWVHYVMHDDEDGAWQFHPASGPLVEGDTVVDGLKTMLSIEPRIRDLADLPLGWHAWRDDRNAQWKREPKKQ